MGWKIETPVLVKHEKAPQMLAGAAPQATRRRPALTDRCVRRNAAVCWRFAAVRLVSCLDRFSVQNPSGDSAALAFIR